MATSVEGPVRHIVMLKVASPDKKALLVDSLKELEKGLTGVTFLSISVNPDLGLVDGNSDVALVIDFPDKENYLAYASHPDHMKIVSANKPYVVGRSAIQFSLGSKL